MTYCKMSLKQTVSFRCQALSWLACAMFIISCLAPAWSQITDNPSLRAVNTARMRAEYLNGGLNKYRAASCMYEQSGGVCLIISSIDGFLFRFVGGEPGWQQLRKPPSLETEMLVSSDGRTVLRVFYNGPQR